MAIIQLTDRRAILWIALPVYLIANAYLLSLGEVTGALLMFASAVYMTILAWLTGRVTTPGPSEELETPGNRTMIWVQIGALAVVILLTGVNSSRVPLWSDLVAWFYGLGESILPVEWFGGPGNAVANPLQYFVIPFILLLILGAKPRELGFGKGHKVWQVCLIWLALPVLIWIGLLATGSLALQTLIRRLIGNTFQNGFFEEFLFRGALQTRLRYLIANPLALTIQGLIFGLWHLRANTQSMDGNILAGLAICIVSQTVSGIVFGYVFQRTRNLIAPSVAHVVMNVIGQLFS